MQVTITCSQTNRYMYLLAVPVADDWKYFESDLNTKDHNIVLEPGFTVLGILEYCSVELLYPNKPTCVCESSLSVIP